MNRRGFTLVEIVVVLLVLGVVAAVSVPAFAALGATIPLESGAAEVQRLLLTARKRSIVLGERTVLTYTPASGRYEIHGAQGGGSRVLASGQLRLPVGVRVPHHAPTARFTFDPQGGGAGPFLPLVDGDGRTMRVVVDRWTGEARVSR